jgi:hypothetical protein
MGMGLGRQRPERRHCKRSEAIQPCSNALIAFRHVSHALFSPRLRVRHKGGFETRPYALFTVNFFWIASLRSQ